MSSTCSTKALLPAFKDIFVAKCYLYKIESIYAVQATFFLITMKPSFQPISKRQV
jgi:hypothetical protein